MQETIDWTSGYVTDVDYTSSFFSEMAPEHLNYALLLRGCRPPRLGEPFTYCELGCGHGLTSNLLAAANPQSHFWATDFNPTHIASARRLAQAGGLANIEFSDASFAEFGNAALPEFDYITLHGVYSWVSDENRRHIVDFVRRKLRPGGAFYISYNCLPGWASGAPMRKLFIDFASLGQEPILRRATKAIDFTTRLAELKHGFFAANPSAASRLKSLKGRPINYIVHEYFNRDWRPQYFSEVSQDLAAAKLVYADSAELGDELETLAMGEAAGRLLNEVSDRTFRETLRDFMRNQQFRRDIFVKGAAPLTVREKEDLLARVPFALVRSRESLPEKFRLGSAEIKLKPEIYGPILEALESGPKTFADLVELPSTKALGVRSIQQALTLLSARNHAAPCVMDVEAAKLSARRFNKVLLDEAQVGDRFQALAAPLIGNGLPVSWIEQVFLAGLERRGDVASFASGVATRLGKRLHRDGKPLEPHEEQTGMLRNMLAEFQRRRLPVLQRVGIA
jgi:SAM-dependent methyltransferase